jgi:glutamate N-acetyltransferase/amino-acid N-acetyltransferase
MTFAEGTQAAGVFTQSSTAAAPIHWCKNNIEQGHATALVVNSGNANAFTGKVGEISVERVAAKTASLMGCSPLGIYIASTGVIGEPLPDAQILDALPTLKDDLQINDWEASAQAIMTTDTFPKYATRTTEIDGVTVTLNGVAKGSGMIAPDMATMLGFITTDANINAKTLQTLLRDYTQTSFNAITVDSDTSTNDCVLAFATCQAAHEEKNSIDDPALHAFKATLESLMIELAQLIVRDGEGASKFISVITHGATCEASAKNISMAIANSPLVKTAIAGEDANWGRIVMAVGKSYEPINPEKLAIWIGDTIVARGGQVDPHYNESITSKYMQGEDIKITVDVGMGEGKAEVWTCDLTHGYISINADYRS